MCGISGFVSKNINLNYKAILNDMGEALQTRGPDSHGIWFDKQLGVGLSHRRLSILDVSNMGHQPMESHSCRYIISFNGEIYNHNDIRENLSYEFCDIKWVGSSDTETILTLFEKRGIIEGVKSLVGMFALAVWDVVEGELYLVRDRIGEKPIFFGWQNDTFLFASELKSFHKHPDFNKEINLEALSLFFKYNYVPGPHSIYKNIFKLKPGTILKIRTKDFNISNIVYWDFEENLKRSKYELANSKFSLEHYLSNLENKLTEAVSSQLISDVPLGAFLSGGIDSSLIVSIMQSISSVPVKTFTIGFEDEAYNEAHFAKEISNYLGTEHCELYLSSKEAIDVIPLLPLIYDEPFSDSSQIPTYLVSKLAKSKVSVVLSGDGGDELFAGYNRYILAKKIWPFIYRSPLFLRNFLAKGILWIKPSSIDKFVIFVSKGLNFRSAINLNLGDKLHKFSHLLLCKNFEDLYDSLISHWHIEDQIVINGQLSDKLNLKTQHFEYLEEIEKMMANDTLSYLPDDILVKLDRAAMANSLESRVPFLDFRIVEYAWQIPLKFKLRSRKTKYILRKILYKYLPIGLVERPKMGFGVPIASWLRGPLKLWAEDLLSEDRIRKDNILNYDLIKSKWDEHQSGVRNWQYCLWDVLMFQAWFENQKKL